MAEIVHIVVEIKYFLGSMIFLLENHKLLKNGIFLIMIKVQIPFFLELRKNTGGYVQEDILMIWHLYIENMVKVVLIAVAKEF